MGSTGSATGALSGLTGGLTSSLPLGGALDSGSSTINGLLGQLQGAGASSSQLAGVLGQLQGLGLGNLPLSALTGTATSTASTVQNQAASTASDPSAANVQKATSVLQGLTVAQAEQYGLLPSGTTGKLLTQLENAAAAQSSANNLASSFTSRTYGFKAQAGANETSTAEEGGDQGGATPTFSIASPEAVASAIKGGEMPSETTEAAPTSTAAADMAKRTEIPSSAVSSSMTPAATASSKPSATAQPDTMDDDSGSDYSEDDDDDEDSEMEEPVTPTSASSTLARRGGPLEDGAESGMDEKKKTHGDMEGQGPNASGAWHATESSSMAQTQSQAVATAEAVRTKFSLSRLSRIGLTHPSARR